MAPTGVSDLSEAAHRPSLADKVHQHLITQFSTGEIRVGDRLNPRQIAIDLKVSRTTVTKAVDRLMEEGFVETGESRHPIVVKLPTQLKLAEPSEFQFSNQTDSCYEALLERVLHGDLAPGEIIKERPIAMEMGVNPATVRRAAEWLRNDGFLERLPRRGWRVSMLSLRDLQDAYLIRSLLEPLAIQGAINRITDEEIEELEEQTDRLIALGEKATVYDRREADHRFHDVIAEASGNKILAETLKPLIRKVLLITTVGFRYGRAARSFEEHKLILNALKQRDEKQVIKLMKKHLRNALKFNAEIWDRR